LSLEFAVIEPIDSSLDSLRVYSRPGCHLCEKLVEELMPLVRGRLQVEVVDIDSSPEWQRRFAIRIPVLEFRGQMVCQYTLDVGAIQGILAKLPGS
jgi:hypothetical protein